MKVPNCTISALKRICLQNGFNWFGFLKTFLVFTNFLTVATWTEHRQKRSCHSHHCIVENDPTCYLLSSMVSQQHTFVTQMRVGLKCKLSNKQLCKPSPLFESNWSNTYVFVHTWNAQAYFQESILAQNGPKRCIFRNFQNHYLGSTMCLWQLPMYQKCTEFFLDQQLKRFSGNKPHKLTQNGPKTCIFRNFQTHYLGSTMCLW